MISLIILGCIAMSYFFMATTMIIKGISALMDTMLDMVEVWAILLLGGIVIGAVELIVAISGASFWAIVGVIIICVLVGWVFGIIGAIFLVIFELAMYAALFAYGILDLILEKLGEWSELGLKYFLGIINRKIVLS
ncbi:MAG: hypothetical protein IJZ53_11220 [Tyzzerella sp.]|nr:hypothetical protein [Tyzzerella sp.]